MDVNAGVKSSFDHSDNLHPILAIHRTRRGEKEMRGIVEDARAERERQAMLLAINGILRRIERDVHRLLRRYENPRVQAYWPNVPGR